jgi:CHASE2 domain-containing sensor protein
MNDYVNLTFAGDKIAMIVADGDSKSNGALGDFSEEWRPRHAELIKGLVKAGASVVALDIAFDRSNRFGTELRASIDQASSTATKVILGVADFDPDLQIPKPLTMDALQDIPAENWAITEAGLGPQGSRYLTRLVLALHPNKRPDERPHVRTISVVPSLALQAFTQAEAGGRKVKAAFIKENRAIELRDEAGRVIKSIPVLDDQPKPENQMDIIVGLADQADLDQASISYQQVYGNLKDERYLSRMFTGKIVLVGVKKDDDRWQVSSSQQRYGFEIHATTISNLLQDITIRPLRWGGALALIVFMSAVALAAQTVLSRWKGPTFVLKEIPLVPFKSEREVKIPLMLIVIVAIYVGFAFLAYKNFHLIVNITYPTTALLLSYLWIGFIKKKTKPRTA